MGDYKKNPKQPLAVKVPNKIRKRITMAKELDKTQEKMGKLKRKPSVDKPKTLEPKRKRSRFSSWIKTLMRVFRGRAK